MLLFAVSVKLVAEIALMALLGQWVLGLLAGAKRDGNVFYRLLQTLTQPFTRLFRAVTPRLVLDRHVPLLTFIALSWVWVFALLAKVDACRLSPGQALCA